jgi:hypothetical protein
MHSRAGKPAQPTLGAAARKAQSSPPYPMGCAAESDGATCGAESDGATCGAESDGATCGAESDGTTCAAESDGTTCAAESDGTTLPNGLRRRVRRDHLRRPPSAAAWKAQY